MFLNGNTLGMPELHFRQNLSSLNSLQSKELSAGRRCHHKGAVISAKTYVSLLLSGVRIALSTFSYFANPL